MVAKILAPLITSVLVVFLVVSTAVAWRFGFHPALGEPLAGNFYPPLAAWEWWQAWGHDPAYRPKFFQGLGLALIPVGAGITAAVSQVFKGGGLGHNRRQRDDRDDAGLGKPAGLLKSGHIADEGDGVVLGQAGRKILRDHSDGHVLIQGASRSGKGTTHVVTTLLTHSGSMLVLDTKGELARITARRRAVFGDVVIWNPAEPRTCGFNPLRELRGDRYRIADCRSAALMLTHTGHSRSGEDGFWELAAADLITALLVQACETGEATLERLWNLLKSAINGQFPEAANGFVQEELDSYAALESRLRSSLNKTMEASLSFLSDPLVHHATGPSQIRSGDLQAAKAPLTIYLSIPLKEMDRLRPLMRLALQMLIKPLLHDEVRVADGREKKRPVLLMLDEFPRLGHMDFIQSDLAVCAGYGVRAALVAQDERDMQRIYGDSQSITTNCTTQCVIPSFSPTLGTVRGWAGEQVVSYGSRQRQPGKLMLPSSGESETRASVLNEREMMRRGKKEVLIFTSGQPPTWLNKIRYWEHPVMGHQGDRIEWEDEDTPTDQVRDSPNMAKPVEPVA
ncbi:type IV secretory system conjugative DNA transfer family protein [Marinivivus vitaminiproducens]|uniref:type IV secretory system conjugative DNA transfer family protein n=1 Tax=Marinivivus vitaminiproducens TaxID=3035935 RepID=UPI0027A24C94|nr:type IV secretory system conjugative DNA transfer family protein [Geminicoccaceae bacterium SCSIO 64248]